jgi:hypothetical protein
MILQPDYSIMVLKLCRHLRLGELKVHIYHGQNRKDTDFLQQYDVVVTTYYTLSAIWRKHNGQPENEKSIFSLIWYRVILDEGEMASHSTYLNTTDSYSSYHSKPTKSTGSGMLRSPFNEAMGDHRNSHPKQARRFRQHREILAGPSLF